ncbi:MAG: hypothetical protein Q9170_002438 [Blastenia crenularia]
MVAQAKQQHFFQPQPVEGARAYYMYSVLHDWRDEQCRQILRNLRDAMKRGYSKILINENAIPDAGAVWQITSFDWTMIAALALAERTEAQWRQLVELVDLRVEGI